MDEDCNVLGDGNILDGDDVGDCNLGEESDLEGEGDFDRDDMAGDCNLGEESDFEGEGDFDRIETTIWKEKVMLTYLKPDDFLSL